MGIKEIYDGISVTEIESQNNKNKFIIEDDYNLLKLEVNSIDRLKKVCDVISEASEDFDLERTKRKYKFLRMFPSSFSFIETKEFDLGFEINNDEIYVHRMDSIVKTINNFIKKYNNKNKIKGL